MTHVALTFTLGLSFAKLNNIITLVEMKDINVMATFHTPSSVFYPEEVSWNVAETFIHSRFFTSCNVFQFRQR